MVNASNNGQFAFNFPRAIAGLENSMKKFPVKKILYRDIFRGKGLEFDSYREFQPDDDASLIDWKASLRANQIIARKYVEERDLNVYFLVDVSNSMLFGSGDKLKSEYAAEVIAALAHLILSAGDKIGLVMFSDNVVKFLRPARSKTQFGLFIKFLSDPSLYGGGFEINGAVDAVLMTVNAPYTVFILVSDFIRTKRSAQDSLKLMGNRFESLAIMIRDKMDEELPDSDNQFAIQDPYSGNQMILDPKIVRDRYRKNTSKQKMMIREMLRHSKIDLLEITTDKNFFSLLSGFLKGRAMVVKK